MKNLICIFLLFLALFLHSCSSESKIEFIEYEDQIDVMADGNLITSYLFGLQLSKPILFPIHSISGEVITRSYPLVVMEGENADHPWQAGVFFTYGYKGYGDVNGNGFWANAHDKPPLTRELKMPSIRHGEILEMKSGRGKGTLATLNHWIDQNNEPILEENRTMDFYVSEDVYKIDFSINLTAIDTTVTFEDSKEGMFAIRVADWLAEKTRGTLFQPTGEYLNAEGDRTEENIWGKRSAWVRLEGEKDGKKIGVAIFHHPQSLNFPTYWHARGYGCFAANPIGQFEFQEKHEVENPQHRNLTLEPGETALFKFRLMVYEGVRTMSQFEEEFNNFSKN